MTKKAIVRLPDWDIRLTEFVRDNYHRPYSFEDNWDCLLFCAASVEAVTGRDFGKKHRGKYKSVATAHVYLTSKLGFSSPEALLDSLFPVKPIGYAQRGDLLLAVDGIPSLCMGSFGLSVGQQEQFQGLVRVPRIAWVKCWGIG